MNDVLLITVTCLTALLAGMWVGNRPSRSKYVVKTYSCPHQEEVEYSVGYRDAARQTKKCGYRLKCSIRTYRGGEIDLLCPEHNVKLKS